MKVNKILTLRTLAGWLISHWVIMLSTYKMSSFVIVQVQRSSTLSSEHFYSGENWINCALVLGSMCRPVNIDSKAQSWCQGWADTTGKEFRFWSQGRLWLLDGRSCGSWQLLRHKGDRRLYCTSLESFPWNHNSVIRIQAHTGTSEKYSF